MKKNLGFEEIKLLLDATFRIIDSAKKSNDSMNVHAEIQFMALFVDTLVSRILSDKGNRMGSKKEQAKNLEQSYSRIKLGIQESVATGFEEAMGRFVNKPIEFYCTIRPVQEPKTQISH